ncbi:MAG: UDP-N-acetylmuramate:L-alanyl-gamma-D-glutamyl-meso-diaminopimelate ligase [Desulfobacteraceae bacterium]|nr:UDP-N-acetylmuramate:L-alanyl-gamma-D-glutamyl-meso-diaminopimelate ligase [Desulfobacteraceae bacterium]
MKRQLGLNRLEKINRIHLIAICGAGMGSLACMLKELGYAVTGSDNQVYPPMSDFLKAHHIPIYDGFAPEHLKPRPDLVIVGNAVSKNNPEVQAANHLGLPYCSMPQAINHFAAAGKKQIVVTGTHGKTTTSSFISWLIYCAGLDPSYLVGGLVSNFQSSYRIGQGQWMVIEGDEYDTAYFDKGPKFLHYNPEIAILTSIEFDHADIFSDLNQIKHEFSRMLQNIAKSSILIFQGQDDTIVNLLPKAKCSLISYGMNNGSDWSLGRVRIESGHTLFEIKAKGVFQSEFRTQMIGLHNLQNLLAGIAVGEHLGIDRNVISTALETFKGVRRRQEVRGIKNGITVIDDFAHHPTAVRETISAVKAFYADQRIIAVFEPRTNSSRRKVFQNVYPNAFSQADLVCIRQPRQLEKIPVEDRFCSRKLASDIQQMGKAAYFFTDTDAIVEYLAGNTKTGDVILVMSNGGFDNIHEKLLMAL